MNDGPQLASLALMVRDDAKSLFVRHAAGPFAGLWTLPFVGVADVETAEDALERLLREYLNVQPGPYEFLDTVYLTAVDGEGNACSFINSLYMGTGSGLVVPGTGVSLQNRASLFVLDPAHPNALAPNKRPYQTIIPALTVHSEGEFAGALHASFGVMGG